MFPVKESLIVKHAGINLGKLIAGGAETGTLGNLARAGIGAGTGYALGRHEISGLEESGLPVTSFAKNVIPWTNAAVGALLGPRLRGSLFGDLTRQGQNRAILNSILLKAGLGNAALLGIDQGIGLSGKAQEAAKGLGDAGKALSDVSTQFKTQGTKVLSDAGIITGHAAEAAKNVGEASKGTGDLVRSLTDATKDIGSAAKNVGGAGEGIGHMSSVISDATKSVKGLGETGNRLADLGTLAAGGAGGTVLGGLLGYGLSDDPDKAESVAERRAIENKRMRNSAIAAALLGTTGAALPFALRRLGQTAA